MMVVHLVGAVKGEAGVEGEGRGIGDALPGRLRIQGGEADVGEQIGHQAGLVAAVDFGQSDGAGRQAL